jgi:hypothetical protein
VEPTSQRWPFFRKRNIYNDLMNIQQGLINNNSYAKRKFKRYFIWPYDQCTNGCAKFRSKIRCEYICANLQKNWLHNFPYREISQDRQQGQDFRV